MHHTHAERFRASGKSRETIEVPVPVSTAEKIRRLVGELGRAHGEGPWSDEDTLHFLLVNGPEGTARFLHEHLPTRRVKGPRERCTQAECIRPRWAGDPEGRCWWCSPLAQDGCDWHTGSRLAGGAPGR